MHAPSGDGQSREVHGPHHTWKTSQVDDHSHAVLKAHTCRREKATAASDCKTGFTDTLYIIVFIRCCKVSKYKSHKHSNIAFKYCFGVNLGSWLQQTFVACRQKQVCLPGFACSSTATMKCASLYPALRTKPEIKPMLIQILNKKQLLYCLSKDP